MKELNAKELRWVPFCTPRDGLHQAHRAYLHAETRACLVLLWYGDSHEAGRGRWEWEVRLKHYREVCVPELSDGGEPYGPAIIHWADGAVGRLTQLVELARQSEQVEAKRKRTEGHSG